MRAFSPLPGVGTFFPLPGVGRRLRHQSMHATTTPYTNPNKSCRLKCGCNKEQ